MRRAITLARPHGKEALQIIQDNTVPFEKQLREFKSRVSAGKSHPQFAEVQLWVSDQGIAKRAKFSDPKADEKAEAAAKAAAEKEAEEKAEAEAREAEAKAAAEKEAADKAAAEKAAEEAATQTAARAANGRQRSR